MKRRTRDEGRGKTVSKRYVLSCLECFSTGAVGGSWKVEQKNTLPIGLP